MNIKSIYTLAKKEVMDNIRNKWIIVISIIFALLTLLASYGGSQTGEWQNIDLTILSLILIVEIVISMIGLMLGFASIGGEIERGSMNSLLSFPLTRLEIILGKFLGLGAILSASILIGFSIAGLIIALNVQNFEVVGFLIFIGLSVLIGLVFLNLSLFFSSFFKKRSSSMGMSIFIWIMFFPLVWGLMLIMLVSFTTSFDDIVAGSFPDWYYYVSLINPESIYSSLVSINIVNLPQESASALPSFYNNGVLFSLLLIWLIVPLLLSYIFFRNRDI